jgi:hypothetical protein
MKMQAKTIFLVSLSILVLAGIVRKGLGFQAAEQTRAQGWKKVEDAMKKGLPKTAIEELGPIIASALSEKQYAEAIKGIGQRVILESQIEGRLPEEHIRRLQAEIDKAPPEMLPVLNTLQAHFYWNYFQQNRWRFGQRTATSAPPSNDFTTWDLKRLFQEIDSFYSKAFASEALLRAIPIDTYSALLSKGSLPDTYRPTLFDFVAHEALDFYSSGEQAGAKSQDAFEIEASSAALGTTQDFLAWNPQSTDKESVKLKTITLLQKLLRMHADDQDRSALLDAELRRLQYCHAEAVGEEKRDRYVAALKAFAERESRHELSAIARHRWATLLMEKEQRVEAREIAKQGANAFPESVGGKLCFNLIAEIEAKSVGIVTERVWSDKLASIRVSYRNINRVHFRLHSVNWRERIKQQNGNAPSYPQPADRDRFRSQKPEATWSAELPATEDFNTATEDVSVPAGLKPGFYFLQASAREDFADKDNINQVAMVWVSNLAMILDQSWNAENLEGFILDNQSGSPVSGAKVTGFFTDNNNRSISEQSTATNKDGRFSFGGQNRSLLLLAEHNGNALGVRDSLYINTRQQPPPVQVQYVLFSDRSIYRPGQTIQYKGICLFADTEANKYNTVAEHKVSIAFRDINGNEIANQTLVSNDFGSFSGTFNAPRDRGTGHMTINVNNMSSVAVQIEEYKRPKFEVKLENPTESPKLNDSVTLTGMATSYTGVPIGNAKVRYHVTRAVRWPIWFSSCFPWRMPINPGGAQEITHGNATTDAAGKFTITFVARPDRSVPEEDTPSFDYQITADVTDTTGETRSAESSISAGYVAMQADVATQEWLTTEKPIEFKIATTTLNGKPLPAKGTLKVMRLKEPQQVIRPDILGSSMQPMPRRGGRGRSMGPGAIRPPESPDPSNIASWESEGDVSTKEFDYAADAERKLPIDLKRGVYRAVVETQDRFGKLVKAVVNFKVIDPKESKLGIKIPHFLNAEDWSLEPGEKLKAVWGTGYDSGRAFVELSHHGKMLQSFWTKPEVTQFVIEEPITEEMRGGLTLRVLFVKENRSYIENRQIAVPWTNKELKLRWERFVSKLEPGSKEKFKLIVEGPKATKAITEVVAAMYDASLDAYLAHPWLQRFSVFRANYGYSNWTFQNFPEYLMHVSGNFDAKLKPVTFSYRDFPPSFGMNVRMFGRGAPGAGGPGGYGGMGGEGGMMMRSNMSLAESAPMAAMADAAGGMGGMADRGYGSMDSSKAGAPGEAAGVGAPPQGGTSNVDLGSVSPRKNLNETAFFFPHVVANKEGSYEMEFVIPEALTSWRVMAFSHDKELRSGYIEDKVVTSKELMVQPNPPRFLREGDVLEFSVKVSNTSTQSQAGKVALKLFDAISESSKDKEFGNSNVEQPFQLGPNESKSFAWKLTVPDGSYPIIYRAIGGTERVSDGEEGMLPVLSKRVLVTESLPLPIRGKTTREFQFKKLLDSAKSDSLKHESLTVQMVSQPAWYAVLALPYLMEYPHDCSEQTFNRLYANSLAQHIAQSDPKIKRVFDTWRSFQPDALKSPLEKNQDLKSVMIEETPWLINSQSESQSRKNIALLFDQNRLASESAKAMQRLMEMQRENGMWPWFPGGPDNEYLSLYIATGFGRMRHLGVQVDMSAAMRALERLDAWMHDQYGKIMANSKDPEANHLSSTIALYLYGRSFFLKDQPIGEQYRVAIQYWQRQAKNHWLSLPRQCQAQVAIGLHRIDDTETPTAILKSIVEFSSNNEEMGMFWRDQERSWWWYHAPIETQAMMIEALDEVAKDSKAVEDCKVWLLKQKQTQDWKTTKSTADAVYALLLRGDKMLSSDELVEVQLAGTTIQPEKVEAGTGFYEQKFLRGEVKPEFGKIKVTKQSAGVSWGSMHWQYLEDVSKVTPYEGTPLKLEKQIYTKSQTKAGAELTRVAGPVQVGDELVCRIVLRTDRDMEYVHLKDHRGSGTEPVSVLSQYRYQDGLAYYESTRDTASHFFIDYLPKGTYVFEYSVRVQHAGKYPTGLATIQCMYAPEFNSHSESVLLEVK